jgi:hypothetical protein
MVVVVIVWTIGISILAGAALSLRFKVLVLFPTVMLAVITTTILGMARGDQMEIIALTMVLAATALQIGYFGGLLGRVAVGMVQPDGYVVHRRKPSMFKMLDVQERMDVVGSDDAHVGMVDHKENAGRIVLSKDDPNADGTPHLISIDWVDYVDSKIHLNKPSERAMLEWRVAA